ncbi:host cell division inhibitor Icd-like protein [Avibacterium paragallinarum]|uniref:host cell division inhibitor Icd-like protein n=1 Tax=Avibacterium paragallinarum TaxID=728 RepID=UPI0021F74FCD|nr:host cell division inhibitor Icd-like protein [Avibacterium paragallinarum]UXN36914.1 host cell division inhibitor Icd-like protein [Avibacterium paragallinarum]
MKTQTNYSEIMNLIHHKIKPNENKSLKNNFTTQPLADYALNTVAKSTVSREKLNIQKANSTPTRAFFVRNVRTPKENNLTDFGCVAFLSMVERNRHAFSVASLPFELVSHPVTFYRPTVRSLAVVFEKLSKGLSAMLYKFLLLGKHRLNPITINFIHHNTKMNENNSQPTPFTKCGDFFSIFTATANSVAEPGNSNDKLVADKCTPLNACFFMRSTNTPKERLKMACSSMVTCYGKGFALCCVPQVAVFQPVTRYRQSLETFAVTSRKLFTCGVNAMKIFIFAAIRRTDLTNQIQKIRIFAESEKQARATLAREFILVLAGRINLKNLSQTHRTLSPFALTLTVAEVKNA